MSCQKRQEIAPLRHAWILPETGDLVWVCDGHDGLPTEIVASAYGEAPVRMRRLRAGPVRVMDRRGGTARRGSSGLPLPPAVIEFQVEDTGRWLPWFKLELYVPHHPRLGRRAW